MSVLDPQSLIFTCNDIRCNNGYKCGLIQELESDQQLPVCDCWETHNHDCTICRKIRYDPATNCTQCLNRDLDPAADC